MYEIARYHNFNQGPAALFEAIATKHCHVRRVVLAFSRRVHSEGASGAQPDHQAC